MKNEVASLPELISDVENSKGLMVYFYSDKCAPCINLRPKIAEMTQTEFSKIRLVFVNSEQHPGLAAHYGVFASPAILVFFDGREFRRYSKYISVSQLRDDITRLYSLAFEKDI